MKVTNKNVIAQVQNSVSSIFTKEDVIRLISSIEVLDQDLKVGTVVKVIDNSRSGSNNRVGDVGTIIEISGVSFRVEVKGRENCANWQTRSEIQVL